MTALKPGDRVMDLGGGTGAMAGLLHAKRPDLRFVCVDPAPGMLRYVPPFALRVCARAEALPFRQVFAGIMIGDALHHFSSPERAVEEIRSSLFQGGRLFIFDISRGNLPGRLLALLERFLGEPGRFYTPEQLREELTRKGFRVASMTRHLRYTLGAILP